MQLESSFINGKFSKVHSNKNQVLDKYTQKIISEVSLCSVEDLNIAIESSKEAFSIYKKYSANKRYDLLVSLIDLFKNEMEDFAKLISREAAKPISYARSEVERSLATLEFAKEECRRVGGEVVPMDFSNAIGRKAFTQKYPAGPVLGISPFNFPLNLSLHKIAPALACGCSIVLKPSPYTPLSSLKFAELVHRAGFPKGLVNVVVCSNEQSEKLVRSEAFSLLSFTGSPDIGWMLKSIAGKKKVTLELGGNAAVIVDEDSDLDKVAKEIAVGSFLYAGQICISTQRVLIHESIYESFKEKLISKTSELVSGDPADEEVSVGPIIDKIHVTRINSMIESAVSSGAKKLYESKTKHELVISPVLLENVSDEMDVWSKEIFGPIAVLKSFKNFQEAVDLSNNSSFGLQVGVFTNSLENVKSAVNNLEVGGVIINSIPGFRVDHMPYGGIKDSGLGREGLKYAIDDMTEEKLLVF